MTAKPPTMDASLARDTLRREARAVAKAHETGFAALAALVAEASRPLMRGNRLSPAAVKAAADRLEALIRERVRPLALRRVDVPPTAGRPNAVSSHVEAVYTVECSLEDRKTGDERDNLVALDWTVIDIGRRKMVVEVCPTNQYISVHALERILARSRVAGASTDIAGRELFDVMGIFGALLLLQAPPICATLPERFAYPLLDGLLMVERDVTHPAPNDHIRAAVSGQRAQGNRIGLRDGGRLPMPVLLRATADGSVCHAAIAKTFVSEEMMASGGPQEWLLNALRRFCREHTDLLNDARLALVGREDGALTRGAVGVEAALNTLNAIVHDPRFAAAQQGGR
jgi:hypothetical protein